MNSKYITVLLMIFGLLFTSIQCRGLTSRNLEEDDNNNNNNGGVGDNSLDNDLEQEKRAILSFLQDEEDASQFLDQSRRLLTSDQKSHMKEAKKKYEEKCESTFHGRYCPDLSTWPAWNQAYNSATGKK